MNSFKIVQKFYNCDVNQTSNFGLLNIIINIMKTICNTLILHFCVAEGLILEVLRRVPVPTLQNRSKIIPSHRVILL